MAMGALLESPTFAALVRRGWIVVVAAAIAAIAAYYVASARSHSYTADAVAVVPSGAGPRGPGNASEAIKLAVTYSVLIPEDERVLRRLARELHLTPDEVHQRLVVFHDADTSLIRLQFRGDSRRTAIAGATAAARAVTATMPVSPSIARSSIKLVSLPRSAASATSTPSTAVVIGLLLGLILGLVVFVAWERSHPQVKNITNLEAMGFRSSAIAEASAGSLSILLQRWAAAEPERATRVAILPVNEKLEPAAIGVARYLQYAGTATGVPVNLRDASRSTTDGTSAADDREARVVLRTAAAPGPPNAGEAVALDSDVVALVAAPTTSISDVRAAAAALRRLGVDPDWALLAPTTFTSDDGAEDEQRAATTEAER
jgi:capsular polysaccharide biosynthesis protein